MVDTLANRPSLFLGSIMRTFQILLTLLAMVVFDCLLAAAEPSLVIRMEPKGWGDADIENIRKVLESSGKELLKHVPPERTIRVYVVPSDSVPQVDYERTKDGEYLVRLAVKDQFWSQYAYQFAHELAHIVSRYDRRHENNIGKQNQWFDEAVGEAASLFVLMRMAKTWQKEPPYANWKDYSKSLAEYAEKRVKESETPEAAKMPEWFQKNVEALRGNPYLRPRNQAVANHLAKMLEANPEHWEAFRYLNLGRPDEKNSFEAYLENWYFSVPKAQKPFVKSVVDLLGVKCPNVVKHAEKLK
jgi:hypothetical protein